MTRLGRARARLADGEGARLLTWVWVLAWGEHAIGEGSDAVVQLTVAAAVLLVVAWEVTQDRWRSGGAWAGALLVAGSVALGGGEHLRESSYLLGWGVAVLVLALPGRRAAASVTVGVLAAAAVWAGQDPAQLPALLLGAVAQLLVVCLLQQLVRTTRRLRRSQEELAQTEVDGERGRLAGELNTLIGRTLAQTAAQASRARTRVAAEDPEVQGHLAEVESLVARGRDQLARLSFEPVVDDLATEVRSTQTLCTRLGVAVNLSVDDVDAAVQPALALLLREAVTNMLKHAAPTRCTVVTRQEEGWRCSASPTTGSRPARPRPVTGRGAARRAGAASWTRSAAPSRPGRFRAGAIACWPGSRCRCWCRCRCRRMAGTPACEGAPMPEPLRLLIAEDVDLVGEAFEALLAAEAGIEVVARVTRGDQVLRAAQAHRPDVALLDIDMPGKTGIQACAELTAALPECKVMLLTALPGSGHLPRALDAGASGYLVKSMTARQLIDGIRSVAAGGTVIDPALAADALRAGPNPLTDREREILRLVDQGCRPATSPRSCSCPPARCATTCPTP
ncbi:helix-turn-helix transcriptional regulator [Barrientosiimonas endolithica]|uniref:Response regulatory domain-containing protein n=1 Tax=Barrientosiimonas endolithica TaxID=1535208 RepID=A0ABM8H769_9MICO|nr:hypothetical protein GCM10025872_03300 [Barrientosiimonas endolithica]